MIPLAKACDFKGSRGDGVHLWREQERTELRAELDAAFFILYAIPRDDIEYILSTFTNTGHIPPNGPSGARMDSRPPNSSFAIHHSSFPSDGPSWDRGAPGHLILESYDRLSTLTSAQ